MSFYRVPPTELKHYYVDLDGTLAEPSWEPEQSKSVIGAPIEANIWKLEEVIVHGYKIFIHTSRPWSDYALIEAWLEHNAIPYTAILCGKPLGHRYVDDKAINASEDSWVDDSAEKERLTSDNIIYETYKGDNNATT